MLIFKYNVVDILGFELLLKAINLFYSFPQSRKCESVS